MIGTMNKTGVRLCYPFLLDFKDNRDKWNNWDNWDNSVNTPPLTGRFVGVIRGMDLVVPVISQMRKHTQSCVNSQIAHRRLRKSSLPYRIEMDVEELEPFGIPNVIAHEKVIF